ncbi:MAG: hypothetical protein ACLFQ8_01880 [Candidatus Aenigmatarchaeota archaeon]
MADEEDSAITFETFRKFQRKEKKNEKLQELPDDFFRTCVQWINRKEEKFEESRDSALMREIENVKSIVKDIFERRRKKILILALHSVRSKKVSKNLLPEEEEFFERTVKNLRQLEENLLERVLKGEEPKEATEEEESKEEVNKDERSEKSEEVEEERDAENKGSEEVEEKEGQSEREEEVTEVEQKEGPGEPEEETAEEGEKVKTRKLGEEEQMEVETSEGQKLLRITDQVERFVATDENEYGPLEEGDIVTLPEDVAKLLIEKDKAKESKV